jgi:hypothetical protein
MRPQVEQTTLIEILKIVEVDYAANGRKSLLRVKHAATHLKEFFDALSSAAYRFISPRSFA